MNIDFVQRENAGYIEEQYERYLRDPASVGKDWAQFFAGFELGSSGATLAAAEPTIGVFDLIHSYRELGHLVADLDPLGHIQQSHPLLELKEFGFRDDDLERVIECAAFRSLTRSTLRELLEALQQTYCRTIGVEFMFISDKTQRDWLKERMEPTRNRPRLAVEDRRLILDQLIRSEGFEQFLHTKFVGQKRFSLEGGESLIPMLSSLIDASAHLGVAEIVMGMAHRGRLNVLANILDKPYELIFSEFQGAFLPKNIQGDGDVKYHLGYARDLVTRRGDFIHVSLLSNPSHLEAINPVVEGIVRAKQRLRRDLDGRQVLPLQIHGDASFTGQGLVAETLALSDLPFFQTKGTIHIIINNQIGFTAMPEVLRSGRYASDIAKAIEAPVFHVNGDDPEAAVQAAQLAAAYRHEFRRDVIIDLICFRRYGHNETDEPTFTQPVMYREIAAHPGVRPLYANRLAEEGVVTPEEAANVQQEFRASLQAALEYARDFMPRQQVFALGGLWKGMEWAGEDWSAHTAVPLSTLRSVAEKVARLPAGFTPHPRVRKLLDDRVKMLDADGSVDWACAEMLALGTLLLEGTKIRLSGEDSGRGTFSHRHAVLHDQETGEKYTPLQHLSAQQGHFLAIDTMLSEAAVLGFEYGFSTADPRNLVIWEAQFGDFANGAQVMIDQFIVAAESKWQRMSGLVLLLPHGYEGQGPEHSSARLERFLQLCAENNMQVCNLTTPAQLFHALRRQIHRKFRKPLVVMSPKSLLRHRLNVSPLRDFTEGTFATVLDEVDDLRPRRVRRLVLCSGKVYYDLLPARRDRDVDDVALVRVEQLYPFPERELKEILARYPNAKEVFWVQEEPWNMGAWHFMAMRRPAVLGDQRRLQYIGRDEAASPATGSYKLHEAEQADIVDRTLQKSSPRVALRKANVG